LSPCTLGPAAIIAKSDLMGLYIVPSSSPVKEFGNFILRLQYKFLEGGNSGVQFRSAAR